MKSLNNFIFSPLILAPMLHENEEIKTKYFLKL